MQNYRPVQFLGHLVELVHLLEVYNRVRVTAIENKFSITVGAGAELESGIVPQCCYEGKGLRYTGLDLKSGCSLEPTWMGTASIILWALCRR